MRRAYAACIAQQAKEGRVRGIVWLVVVMAGLVEGDGVGYGRDSKARAIVRAEVRQRRDDSCLVKGRVAGFSGSVGRSVDDEGVEGRLLLLSSCWG